MLKPPLPTSIAPSSPTRPCSRPPSRPTMVQYGCSPLKPRGNQPRVESAATDLTKSFGVAAKASGCSAMSAMP